MASKAALVVLALAAGTATAGTPINTDKYTAIAEAGACRGNGLSVGLCCWGAHSLVTDRDSHASRTLYGPSCKSM